MVCEDHSSRMFLHAMTSSVRNDIHMYNKWREHVKLCRQMGGEKCYLASAHELIFLNRSPPSPSPFPFPFPSPLPPLSLPSPYSPPIFLPRYPYAREEAAHPLPQIPVYPCMFQDSWPAGPSSSACKMSPS